MELKNRIKLIGVDLDGTLLNDNKQLCSGAAEILSEAHRHGIHIVPITGRPLSGIPECIRSLNEIEYIISSNGSQITDAKTGRSIYSFTISNEKSRKIIKLLRTLNCMFEPFADGVGYAEPDVYEYYKATYTGTPIEDYIFSSRKVCESIEALFDGTKRRADEFFVNCSDKSVRDSLIESLNEIGGLQYCSLADRFIEITKEGTDKGEALETICRHLGVPTSQTIAFGDGENDLLFLEKAGVAVAMENAFPSVKEKADIIAKSNNDNGVCEIIKALY